MAMSGSLTSMHGVRANRIAIQNDVEPEDWQDVFEHMEKCSAAFSYFLFNSAVGVATMTGMFAVMAGLTALLAVFFPYVPQTYLACFTIPPALLAGVASGQFGGNCFLHFQFGIDQETRRGFATRLTLAHVPEDWPLQVKKWLFTGDWLKSPIYDPRLPYVRIFVSGKAPATCAEEDCLWREIHHKVSGDSLWEAGANYREISYPQQLPSWARKVEPGDGVAELDERLGQKVAREWIDHLWRRACKQWPLLGSGDYPTTARKECFETHHLYLFGNREALLVVLRPSFFAEEVQDKTLDKEDSIAA